MSRTQAKVTPHRTRSRLRRWLILAVALTIALAAYVWEVSRVAQRLGNDMQRSIQAVPAVQDTRHRRD